jgi:hypothetical protein
MNKQQLVAKIWESANQMRSKIGEDSFEMKTLKVDELITEEKKLKYIKKASLDKMFV